MNLLTLAVVLGYALVPTAFVLMMKHYAPSNWVWLVLLLAGCFIGVGIFVALAYIVSFFFRKKSMVTQKDDAISYHPDGSYTVYPTSAVKEAPSAGRVAFRVVGGLMAGAAICCGLFIIGMLMLITASCSGNSKCM